jgi:type IV pilus assembly protein PilC
MATYSYSAVDGQGNPARGTMQATSLLTALRRIKEMGFFPVKVREQSLPVTVPERPRAKRLRMTSATDTAPATVSTGRMKPKALTVFTRQLATMLEAGLPLLRGLRLIHDQEENRKLKAVISGLAAGIENGGSFSEALAQFPRVFSRLYVNLVKAGEISGTLELTLRRLADFMEKAGRIKGRVMAALFYPAAVMTVAFGVITLMLVFIVPRFKDVFGQLSPGHPLPSFTLLVFGISDMFRHKFPMVLAALAGVWFAGVVAIRRTRLGRRAFDLAKLRAPVFGPVFRKLAIARFTRTLGTLVTSGVPVLQALTIVKEAAGNVIVGRIAERVRENVEQGESITGPLRSSNIFPAMVVGMIEVGEQTGALPEMLNRIADNYDEEVDNAVESMTSLLEPIMIVFLGLMVGCIVVAMFLPIINLMPDGGQGGSF